MARQIVAVVPNTFILHSIIRGFTVLLIFFIYLRFFEQENSLYSEPTRNNDHETRLKKIKIKEIIKAFTSR